MPTTSACTQTDASLLPVLEELRLLEPIFHTPAFGRTLADFDRRMAPTYWEVGASGRRYSRAFILQMFARTPPELTLAGWHTSEHALQQLVPGTYLFTYTLAQGSRLTRRATLWLRTVADWQILYHQGTHIAADGDDIAPPPL